MLETVPPERDVTSQSCLWVVSPIDYLQRVMHSLFLGCWRQWERSLFGIEAGWWPRTHWQGSQQHPLAEAMDLTSLSEFWTLSGCIFLPFFFVHCCDSKAFQPFVLWGFFYLLQTNFGWFAPSLARHGVFFKGEALEQQFIKKHILEKKLKILI